VSADCGIRELEACGYAADLGLDLIVTDHHLPDSGLPPACAILNPRQSGCSYPEKNLAAVGVVLKLVQALFQEAGREKSIPHFLKVAAIGTVADLVPVTGENRVIVKHGLSALSQPYNLGLQALLQGSGVGREVDHSDVGFKLAPRINAFTRMGGGKEIVDLFSANSPELAQAMVNEMNQKNQQRQFEEQKILAEIEDRVDTDPKAFEKSFLLVAGQDWHKGVIGNVAARLAERFYRPVIVLSVGDETTQGSGRSIPGFHLLQALDHCRQVFQSYGGHAQAVGCTLVRDHCDRKSIAALERRLQEYADTLLSPEKLIPSIRIDSFLPLERLSLALVDELDRLAPFGHGNPVPVFASKNVKVSAGPWVLKEKHLKLRIECNGAPVDTIWWRRADAADRVKTGPIDIAYTLDRNSYLGEDKLLLTLRDLRNSTGDLSNPS
jgi:single-stranded-DNA-specific exonuclease